MTFKGTHGTSARRAASIKLDKFNLSLGRVGSGAYFWAASHLAEHLARGWFKFNFRRGHFDEYPNAIEAVIFVTITCDELEHIDAEEQIFKNQMQRLALTHNPQNLQTADQVAKMHSLVISQFERESGKECKVLEVRLSAPKPEYAPQYLTPIYGTPICYVVRDGNCIAVDKVV